MPLWRYFAFSGSVLLAFLLLADWCLPKSSADTSRVEVDKTVIRIHTAKQWPDAVVFDTNRPTMSAPVSVAEAAPVEAPMPAVETSTRETSTRQAFAQLAPAAPIRPAASDAAPNKEVAKKMAARHPVRARAPVRRLASYQPTESRGFFPFGW